MTNTPRLSKSGIEYLDLAWGIFHGCQNHLRGICPIPNCWAKGIVTHYSKNYRGNFEEPTFYPEACRSPSGVSRPSIIGVGWMGDIIGYGKKWKNQIYNEIENCPRHLFLFLTKNLEEIKYWEPFPENCGVGITTCFYSDVLKACRLLASIEARLKFLSIEPMLDDCRVLPSTLSTSNIGWVVIGGQTRPKLLPPKEYIEYMTWACAQAKIPIFLKDNLQELGLPLERQKPVWERKLVSIP